MAVAAALPTLPAAASRANRVSAFQRSGDFDSGKRASGHDRITCRACSRPGGRGLTSGRARHLRSSASPVLHSRPTKRPTTRTFVSAPSSSIVSSSEARGAEALAGASHIPKPFFFFWAPPFPNPRSLFALSSSILRISSCLASICSICSWTISDISLTRKSTVLLRILECALHHSRLSTPSSVGVYILSSSPPLHHAGCQPSRRWPLHPRRPSPSCS